MKDSYRIIGDKIEVNYSDTSNNFDKYLNYYKNNVLEEILRDYFN